MKNIYRKSGFVDNTIWRAIKCIFNHHWWMCLTEVDENGNYVQCPQIWMCRVCAKSKKTFKYQCQTRIRNKKR